MKENFLIVILLGVLLYGRDQDTAAKTWIEDFNHEGHLKSWKNHDPNRSTWQAKDGHLDVWIDPLQHHAIIHWTTTIFQCTFLHDIDKTQR